MEGAAWWVVGGLCWETGLQGELTPAACGALPPRLMSLRLVLSCLLCGDARFPLLLLTLLCVPVTLRLGSSRHTRSILENRLQLSGKRFLELPSE